jgi:hypothetical protein
LERRNLLAAGVFYDSGQELGDPSFTRGIAIADLDSDGDLDTVEVDTDGGRVFVNQGGAQGSNEGAFIDSGQSFGSAFLDVKLGDLDGDGDLDAFLARIGPNEVWLNDGAGNFHNSGLSLGNANTHGVDLGDVDGDGDLDAYFANRVYESTNSRRDTRYNTVWINEGTDASGQLIFRDSGQRLGNGSSIKVAMGDLNGDGWVDAFVANHGSGKFTDPADRAWINQGTDVNGQWLGFASSGQEIGIGVGLEEGLELHSAAVSLGDFDGDQDLDAFVVRGFEGSPDTTEQPDLVWLNDGNGFFTDSGLRLGADRAMGLTVGDVNGDGYLDAFVANVVNYAGYHQDSTNSLWVNKGTDESGNWRGFDVSEQDLTPEVSYVRTAAFGDLDGDNDLDLFFGLRDAPSLVYFNGDPPPPPPPSFAIDDVAVNEGGDGETTVATFTVTRSGDLDVAVSVEYATADDTATSPDDYSAVAPTTLNFGLGETSKTISVTIIGDSLDEGDHQFYVNLSNPTGGATISDAQGVGTILDNDAPVAPSIHVADLDAVSSPGSRGKWEATVTVTVVDSLGQVMAGVTVTGFWNDDPSAPVTITTDANGVATFTRTNINKKESSLTFTVANLSVGGYQYDPLANEDEDGDSDGTNITVLQP